jgi:hypothetical protein
MNEGLCSTQNHEINDISVILILCNSYASIMSQRVLNKSQIIIIHHSQANQSLHDFVADLKGFAVINVWGIISVMRFTTFINWL